MVKWKFKTFIFIYSILCIAGIAYLCNYVWKGLEQYQSDYDKEYENSDPTLAIDEYIEGLDVSKILDIVKKDNNIKVTAFESKDYIIKMYEDNYKASKFSYVEDKNAGNSSKKKYDVYADKKDKVLTVMVESSERTEQFGFGVWKVTDVSLQKYYEPGYSVTLRVPSNASVTVNGVTAVQGESCKIYEDLSYDEAFAKEVIKFTGRYEKYTYYEISNLYRQPDVQVNDGKILTDYVVTQDGVNDYEVFADTSFIQSIYTAVMNAESSYADFIARFKEIDTVTPYLIPGSSFAKETNAALTFLQFVKRPTNVTYQNWVIKDVKKYGDDKFVCNITYKQNVYYGGKKVQYDSDKMAVFVKQGEQWKIAYQKNRQET